MERINIIGWKRYVLVQPPLMMMIFAQAITSNILTDLIVYRTCSITLDINKTECLLLHKNSSCTEALKIDEQVQPKASLILMSKSFIESIIPALLSLFLGPWSDLYGRKLIILSGYAGKSLTYFILSIMTIYDISPWFLLIAYIPYAFSGGFSIILLGTICYICDISNEQERGWQLAWMEALISIGVLTGILAGPVIFQAYGYVAVFGSAAVCCVLAGLHIYFLVPETIYNRNSITLGTMFDIHLVKRLINTCIQKREGFNRYIVWCCITSIILMVVVLEGEMTIGFLFVNARLGWDVNTYSIYVATNIILKILGILIGVKILVVFGGLSEEVTAILSLFSSLSSSIVESFTLKSWHMYLSAVVGMFSGVASPMIRTTLSKSVPPEDNGKVFSMTVSIETLTPFLASSLYSIIYSYFMPPIYPVPVWFVSVGIFIIVIFLLINIKIQSTRQSNPVRYVPLPQDSEILT
ncbi:proton-coupled folate transporter-like [Osmia bicornis bicornis]|uniref:proton-coupled folate transporter-like n=1 Tax=Osmia bicornis bicornis TaxID=1437191 RepID=UPI0010F6E2F8|nr:proton-coupled folate transporter-like [Osmia bicornis bicornis]